MTEIVITKGFANFFWLSKNKSVHTEGHQFLFFSGQSVEMTEIEWESVVNRYVLMNQ